MIEQITVITRGRERTLILTVVPAVRSLPANGEIPEQFRRGIEG